MTDREFYLLLFIGKGILSHANKNVYSGEWVDDKRCGIGRMLYADGSVYDGAYFNDRRHGKGVLKLLKGDVYEGDFERGLFVYDVWL